jgi:hypothetical protein
LIHEIDPQDYFTEGEIYLLKVDVAPDVLAVNTDFDEGNVSVATGRALPDSLDFSLKAKQDHLDGLYSQDEVITDDLHNGWFGIRPGTIPDEVFDGATVTIRKVDEPNSEFGGQQQGQVGFYATWEENGSTVERYIEPYDYDDPNFTPTNLVGLVYGSSSDIPEDAEFWMEGFVGGEITLEFKMVKGDLEIIHEQEFLVATEQSSVDWKAQMEYQIRLQTQAAGEEVSVFEYNENNEFMGNRKYIHPLYEYYAQLHAYEPADYTWPGMAKLAAAPIYAGMSDAQWGRDTLIGDIFFDLIMRNVLFDDNPTNRADVRSGLQIVQTQLMKGNIDIFGDLAWQFHAHNFSGIYALRYIDENEPGAELVWDTGWGAMESSIRNNDSAAIATANQSILRREQEVILDDTYTGMLNLGPRVSWLFSILAQNPIVIDGPSFRDVVTDEGSNLFIFEDRWQWITNSGNGMVDLWLNYSTSQRQSEAAILLRDRADEFNMQAPFIDALDFPIK